MNKTIIERVTLLAEKKGEKPTVSMKAAEVGYNLFVDLRKGKKPSYEKVALLADYFNTTTDYLLGRTDDPTKKEPTHDGQTPLPFDVRKLAEDYMTLTPENQAAIRNLVSSLSKK